MKNIEKFTEEIKKQLLNVKLMGRDDRRYLYNNQPEYDNPFVTPIDRTKDESYVKIIEFKDGYECRDIYYTSVICEVKRWFKPEISEMQIEINRDGHFIISGVYISYEYWGKLDI